MSSIHFCVGFLFKIRKLKSLWHSCLHRSSPFYLNPLETYGNLSHLHMYYRQQVSIGLLPLILIILENEVIKAKNQPKLIWLIYTMQCSGGKDCKSCELGRLAVPSHSEPLQWEKIGKVANQVKLAVPSHYEPLQWEKIGKVVNRAKLAIPSHSEPLWWEKIGKVANWAKLAILSHSELLRWEKIGKVVNRAKLAILSHSGPLWWEKIGKVVNWANWPFQVILGHFGGKGLEKL